MRDALQDYHSVASYRSINEAIFYPNIKVRHNFTDKTKKIMLKSRRKAILNIFESFGSFGKSGIQTPNHYLITIKLSKKC